MDWTDLQHFLALAREGTLSAAARSLNVDHVTVARRVAALEESMSLKLVDRRPRSYELTEDGKRIAKIGAPMAETAFAVERAAQASKSEFGGEITISAPPSLANLLIAPNLIRLRRQHPGITIKLIGEKRTASLNRREADLALRLSRPTEPGLIARKIGYFEFALYASPDYLKATAPHAFTFVAYDSSMDEAPQQRWLMRFAGPREIVLRTNDLENQAAAARTGIGLAALPKFLGETDPRLERHDVGGRPVGREVWLVLHRDLRRTPAVRAVASFIEGCLS
ncbi:LysR family transcriptional regulator [Bradyrhizobium manausense]|uniref:LysR family transcriptional regulator n=1 Tax=Bradyrhizobium manausense TaxID=989370 RepID=UPI001BA444F7|nr:LysR family transcriptional regulator [Bradyrhizobium manausense]MBR0793155.1 LysR family transcriptional regulator [Bradyrhizobium manausense]